MSTSNTPAFLSSVLTLLAPLRFAADNEEYLRNIAAAVGWDLDEVAGFDAGAAAAHLRAITHGFDAIIDHIASPPQSLSELVAALDDVGDTFAAVRDLGHILGDAGSAYLDVDDFVKGVLEGLVIASWFGFSPVSFSIAEILGLVVAPDDGPLLPAIRDGGRLIRRAHRRGQLRLDRLGPLLRDPLPMLREEYFAGDALATTAGAHQAADKLFPRLARLACLLELSARYGFQPAVEVTGGAAVVDRLAHMLTLYVAPNDGDIYGVTLALSSAERGHRGLLIRPFGAVAYRRSVGDWNLRLDSSGSIGGLLLGPDGIQTSGGASWSLALAAERTQDNDATSTAVGGGSSTGITFGTVRIEGETELGQTARHAALNVIVDKAHFALASSDGDGFLASVLPPEGLSTDFDFTVGWSSETGLHFSGSAGLVAAWPLHASIGPVTLDSLNLGIVAEGGAIHSHMSLDAGLNFGPLAARIDRVGLEALVTFPDGGGNLGPLQLEPAFKPPTGVGLSLDAGAVKGGGYLRFDPDKEEYAGALELVFSEVLNLKGIGLITTRLPDGADGFSLIGVLTAEFPEPGYQLGWGFKLLGVGGLIGVNRTVCLDALVEGVRTGAVNSVMFPNEIIANASRLISDLRTFFPPAEGKFLIGPMAKIGWGTPTLLRLSLGIIIETPNDGDITIVGVLRVALPSEDAGLLLLQANFVGRIEFDKQRGYLYAALYESRVLTIPIDGQIGALVDYGEDANFLVSAGGFNPRFEPPPLPFPTPTRITVNIANSSTARIRAEGYFAVTSNTAQFGARAELDLGLSEFRIRGEASYDALFQLSPFFFIADISASVTVEAFGVGTFSIRLQFELEGPTPWRARGEGSISLWLFDLSVDFDITWGETLNTTLPPIAVMPLVKGEVEKPDNWRALLPPSNHLLVTLRKMDDASTGLVLHPLGGLRVSQRAVPLDLGIDKIGAQKPNDVKRLWLKVAGGSGLAESGGGNGLAKTGDARELFAPAQFQNMDDAAKLSRPAFQKLVGGIDLNVAGQEFTTDKAVKRVVRYEEIIIDSNHKRFVQVFVAVLAGMFQHFLKGSAVSKSPLSKHHKQQLTPFTDKIKVKLDSFTVASTTTNKPFDAGGRSFASEAMAWDYLRRQVANDPNLTDAIHVIPEEEVNLAA